MKMIAKLFPPVAEEDGTAAVAAWVEAPEEGSYDPKGARVIGDLYTGECIGCISIGRDHTPRFFRAMGKLLKARIDSHLRVEYRRDLKEGEQEDESQWVEYGELDPKNDANIVFQDGVCHGYLLNLKGEFLLQKLYAGVTFN